jgi:hypothetical protein
MNGCNFQKGHSMLNALANDSTEIEFVQACGEPGTAGKAWLVGPPFDPSRTHRRLDSVSLNALFVVAHCWR